MTMKTSIQFNSNNCSEKQNIHIKLKINNRRTKKKKKKLLAPCLHNCETPETDENKHDGL